jgi:uncharacterized DUF497 family protein
VLFDWDQAKHERNLAERGFGFDFASLVFEGDTIEKVDHRRDYREIRIVAIGEVDGFVLTVVYTDRGDVRWIISARLASRKERRLWHAR